MDKKGFSERDICTKYIAPALEKADWDPLLQVREELSLTAGIQQALGYAALLQVPFAFSSNGEAFLFHDALATDGRIVREIGLDEFPSPEELWQLWSAHKGLTRAQQALVTQDYYSDGDKKGPRYYQALAINNTIEAIAQCRASRQLRKSKLRSYNPYS